MSETARYNGAAFTFLAVFAVCGDLFENARNAIKHQWSNREKKKDSPEEHF